MPVVRGLPPVTWAVIPGNESEGMGVCACEYSAPPPTSLASSEPGWLLTYHSRSDWCRPSTEISSTWEIGFLWCPPGFPDPPLRSPAPRLRSPVPPLWFPDRPLGSPWWPLSPDRP